MSAQTTAVIMKSFYLHNIGKVKGCLGRTAIGNLDTTHWRNPKTIRESVLMFSSDSIHLPYAQEKLKEKLLGFFYNPSVTSYTNGIFVLNMHKRIYKKNGIDLRYRKFVKKYYDEMNTDICKLRNEGQLDEYELAEQFKSAQHDFCRDIIE